MSKRHEPAELRVLEHLRGEHDHLKHPKFGCHWCLDKTQIPIPPHPGSPGSGGIAI